MSEPSHANEQTWDELLLAAGFEIDPDASFVGRAADEAAVVSDGERHAADPWVDKHARPEALTAEQRAYIDAASPAFGAELPSQSLSGDDPFGDITDASLDAADHDVIDFD